MKQVTLQFHPASDPPDADTTVLISDGEDVVTGWYQGVISNGIQRGKQVWYEVTGVEVEARAWAHLPDPEECIPEIPR